GFTLGSAPVTVDVLANDTDPDGNGRLNPASVKLVSQPAHGAVTVDPATGKMTYTRTDSFVGTDVFTYTVTDFPGAESAAAAVRVKTGVTGNALFTVAGAGEGGGPVVSVFNADGSPRASFLAYEESFRGGVHVAVADVDGDGVPDVVTGAGVGGGPVV